MPVSQFPDALDKYQICTSLTRPSAPFNGMQIFETDTLKTLFWYASKSAWLPPWNTAWGVIHDPFISTSNSAAYSVTGNSDMVMTNVSARNDRDYVIKLHANHTQSGAGIWVIAPSVDGVTVGRFYTPQEGYALGDMRYGEVLWRPATTSSTFTLRVTHEEVTGAVTYTYNGSATGPRQFWVEDIGPRP